MNGSELVRYIDSICDKVDEIKAISNMIEGIEVHEPSSIHIEKGLFEIADCLGKKIQITHYGDNCINHYFEYRGLTFYHIGEVEPW